MERGPWAVALEALEYPAVLEAVAAHAATEPGRRHLLRLRPGGGIGDLPREYDRIEALVAALERGEPLPFDGVRDIAPALEAAALPGTRLDPADLLAVAAVAAASRRLRKLLRGDRESFAALQPLDESLADLPELEAHIGRALDESTGEVRDAASPELKRIRKAIASVENRSRSRLEALVRRYTGKGWLLESGFTLREDRYVLAVRAPHRGKIRGIVHGASASGGTFFIEPEELVQLGNERRRLAEEEREEIRRILLHLTDEVREHLPELAGSLGAIAHLDSLQARAAFARRLEAFRPRLGGDTLRLVGARHPLLALRKGLAETVPLDLTLEPSGRVLVITGPNAGGKTVALKTVGLATALAHAGIWPPCGEGTVLPALGGWHVLIGDEQSLEGDLSSFSAHLAHLNEVFEEAAGPKLVLVDEIASGTDPGEGAALAMAFLETAVERGWWTLVTTHMGALKAFAHRTEGVRNGSMQFDREELRPTYRFLPDLPGSSYALEIARRVGLPEFLLERARELLGEERERLEDLINELADRLGETERAHRDLEIRRSEAAGLEHLLRERLARLDAEADRRTREAADEAERILREANRAFEHAVKEIREKQASHEAIKKAKQLLESQKEKVERIRRPPPPEKRMAPAGRAVETEPGEAGAGPLRVGDTALLPGGARGEVLALQGGRVQVATGSVKVWLDAEEVKKAGGPGADRGGGVKVSIASREEVAPVSPELQLRGMRVEEAEAALEKYLEDLAMVGLSRARVVHGKGTGALRAMVHELLNGHPLVRHWRLGEAGEGGDGVTIVELK